MVAGTPVSFIHVSDRDRAVGFYCGVLGLTIQSSDDFGLFLEVDGGLIRMTALPDYKAGQHPVFGWHVSDIAAAARDLRSRGVAFTIYEGMDQDDLGIWTAPDGVSKVAWFNDPDGNLLSLSQS